jgi:hypothetical protein
MTDQKPTADAADTTTPTTATDSVLAILGAQIASAIEKGTGAALNHATPRRATFDEVLNRPGNPFHPARAKTLTRRYIQ